jgi:hypothetical protein
MITARWAPFVSLILLLGGCEWNPTYYLNFRETTSANSQLRQFNLNLNGRNLRTQFRYYSVNIQLSTPANFTPTPVNQTLKLSSAAW